MVVLIFFKFVWISSYLQRLKKTWLLHIRKNQVFYFNINSSRSKQNKMNHEHPFLDIVI